MTETDDPPFVYPLLAHPPEATVASEPFDLSHEERAEVNRQLDEIDECRAHAQVSARDYIVR